MSEKMPEWYQDAVRICCVTLKNKTGSWPDCEEVSRIAWDAMQKYMSERYDDKYESLLDKNTGLSIKLEELRNRLKPKPIETAPKDGTNILLKFDLGFVEAYWWETGNEQCWVLFDDMLQYSGEPTHWLPLPQRPEIGEE